jgi:predicted metalloprotease with PDZ domain
VVERLSIPGVRGLRASCTLLVLASASSAQEPAPKPANVPLVTVAALGVVTRTATLEEAKELGLAVDKCAHGLIVTEVVKESGAAKAGIEPGDVLLQIGRIDLFSGDDLADFLRVSRPWQTVEVLLRRARNVEEPKKEETVSVTLSAVAVAPTQEPVLAWQFASLAQLPEALARAKEQKRLVLVGLSGAET